MKQSNMQERISHLCSHLCCWFLRGLPSAAKISLGWWMGHPQVQLSLSLSSPLPSPPPLTSCPCVCPQSHKNIKSLSLWLLRPCWQFLFSSSVSVSRSNVCTKTKCLSEEATSSFQDIKLKAVQLYLMLVLSAAWRLTSSKALRYFWGRVCNNIKARTH